MKRTSLNTPRRMFLAVIVGLVLVLAWNLGKEWRSDVRSHRVGISFWAGIVGEGNHINLGGSYVLWAPRDLSSSLLMSYSYGNPGWEFAPCDRKELAAVTPNDARGEVFGQGPDGLGRFGADWRTNSSSLIIHDGQIILARMANATQTVYAIQAVEHKDGNGYFRSRKILPAPRGQ